MKIFKEKAFYKFLIPSSVGAFLFIIPLWYGGNATLPIAFAASFLLGILKGAAPHIIYSLIAFSCLATSINKLYKPSYIQQNVFLNSLFNVTGFWFFVRIVGFIFATMTYFKIGAFAIISPTTGGLVLGDLLPILICVFFLSGLFLPLLLNYGLLDFAGVLLVKFMRPVFNLPGASALDCLASWLGDGSIGVLMTSRQYEQGYYSRREAAVIATNFSAVSVTFSLVVVSQVGLSHMFLPFYFTVAAAGLFASIVVPKLPPLSKIPDIYHKEIPHTEDVPLGISPIKYGLSRGMERAKNAPGVTGFLRDGAENVLNMYLSVVPVIMTFGTLALALAHYTPIFKILGLPFLPLYRLLQIPEAAAASETVMVGFADMFLPSVLATGIKSELTRFVVAATSVTQLIYMSEIGSIILGSPLPLPLSKLFIIFIERTLVTLPIIAAAAHFIF